MATIAKIVRMSPRGFAGPTTTEALIAALAASPPDNAQKLALATALGFPVYANRDLADAALATGATYFNSTTFTYDTASA